MPIIEVKFAAAPGRRVARREIAETASTLAADVLGKSPAVTAVVVEEVSAEDWFCGGHALAESGLASFWLSIRITEGTNTRAEMTEFIAATFAAMGRLLGPLHEESYIHVMEARGFAYGYGGRTQDERAMAARMKAPVPA